MYLIQNITADANQSFTLTLLDGSILNFSIRYVPMQYGWFFTSINYGDFNLNGVRITTSPNMLRQFKNELGFGISCITQSNREPTQQQDFASGASNLYFLTGAEVEQYESYLSNG